jgi:hypothetical protein
MFYATIRKAIVDRHSLTGIYGDYVRFFSPYAIGKDRNGVPTLVAFQYGGGKRGSLSGLGEWCCFQVGGLRAVRLNGDRWVTGPPAAMPPVEWISEIDISADGVTQPGEAIFHPAHIRATAG